MLAVVAFVGILVNLRWLLVLLWSKPGPCVQKAMTNGFFNPEWMANNYVCNLQIRALLNLFFFKLCFQIRAFFGDDENLHFGFFFSICVFLLVLHVLLGQKPGLGLFACVIVSNLHLQLLLLVLLGQKPGLGVFACVIVSNLHLQLCCLCCLDKNLDLDFLLVLLMGFW